MCPKSHKGKGSSQDQNRQLAHLCLSTLLDECPSAVGQRWHVGRPNGTEGHLRCPCPLKGHLLFQSSSDADTKGKKQQDDPQVWPSESKRSRGSRPVSRHYCGFDA